MAGLPKPVKVSPLIKFTRWALLLVGISYGAQRKAILEAFEKTARVKRNEENKRADEREALRRKKDDERNMREIAANFGVILPPDWEPPK